MIRVVGRCGIDFVLGGHFVGRDSLEVWDRVCFWPDADISNGSR